MLAQHSSLSSQRLMIQHGVIKSEINNFLRIFIERGYESVSIVYPESDTMRLIIKTSEPSYLTDNNNLRLNQIEVLTALRLSLDPSKVGVVIDSVENPSLSAVVQSEVLASKIEEGVQPRRAANGVIRGAMKYGARGVEVTVAGKVKGARAKKLYFRQGWMVKSGEPKNKFVQSDIRHIKLKQGIIGVKVSIMAPGPRDASDLPDRVLFHEDREKQRIQYEKKMARLKEQSNSRNDEEQVNEEKKEE